MRYTIEQDGTPIEIDVQPLGPQTWSVRLGDRPARIVRARRDGDVVHLIDGLKTTEVRLAEVDSERYAWADGQHTRFALLSDRAARIRARSRSADGGSGDRTIRSPMPGRVVKVLVAEGDRVAAGQGVVIVEAMKMENELRAGVDGTVSAVRCAEGDLVDGGAELIVLAE